MHKLAATFASHLGEAARLQPCRSGSRLNCNYSLSPTDSSLRREPKRRVTVLCCDIVQIRRANTVRPYRDNSTVQLFYGTSRTPSPTICAEKLQLVTPPSDEGGGAALAVTEGEKREANKSCRKFGVASACIM